MNTDKYRSTALSISFLFLLLSSTPISATEKLLANEDLEYLGAFRVPQGDFGSPQYSGFNYGGTGLTYNPANNSLFLVGHNSYQLVAEISIPQVVDSTSLEDLHTASIVQEFADPTEGNRMNIGKDGVKVDPSGVPLGGFLVWEDKLVGTAYGYYDAASEVDLSHFLTGLDLDQTGDFQGMYKVGQKPTVPNPAFVDGYMTMIPEEWQERFGGPALTGNCCLSIIGRTSLGPAASVFNPAQFGNEEPVSATPVVGYPLANPTLGTYGDTDPEALYNGSMSINGVVFPKDSRSVLFFGRRGAGEFCYGGGVSDPDQHRTYCDPNHPTVLCCYDPVNGAKGGHSYPYVYLVLAYDALDLLAVKNKEKEMWDVLPYGVWELPLGFDNSNPQILGAAYDPGSQRLYLSQGAGDRPGCCGRLPVIHVYQLNVGHDVEANLQQAVGMLRLLVGLQTTGTPLPEDSNGDGLAGLAEVIWLLRSVAGH